MKMEVTTYWQGLIHLLFPQKCAGCEEVLAQQEVVICSHCLLHLPKTDHHLDPENQTAKQLWGKAPLNGAASMLYVSKSSSVQRMLHQLKYGGQREVGLLFGDMFGELLVGTSIIENADLIVPIPLHPKKLRTRGYNQSEYFAKGLSESLNIPYRTDLLLRVVNSTSQTQKSRDERYDNVSDVFKLGEGENTKSYNHILLVDDVVTTGATLASAANQLLHNLDTKVSVLTIARA